MNQPAETGWNGIPLLDARGDNLIVIIGAPRSGTTWIAKIFDSHPRVLYRHEPDTVLRAPNLPVLCPQAEIDDNVLRATHYLAQLMMVRTLKTAGSLPIFAKDYRSFLRECLHRSVVYGLRIADALPGARWARGMTIPDMISASVASGPVLVFKTVSARGRAGLFARAMPESRIIFILRHPCGQVASTLAGIRNGKFERRVPFDEILDTDEARAQGLKRDAFGSLPPVEKAAWHWAILNQKALNDLGDNSRVTHLRYEDMGRDPLPQARALFDFARLPWNSQTEAFLLKSSAGSSSGSYFDIVRNSQASANRWRQELSATDQAAIMHIAMRFPVGQFYADV